MRKTSLTAMICAALLACDSSNAKVEESSRGAQNGDAGDLASTDGGSLEEDFLPPPPPGEGIQLKMVATIEPGVEDRLCQFYQIPPEGLWVNKEEMRYRGGGHHSTTWKTSYKTFPTKNKRGEPVDVTNGPISCDENGVAADWEIGETIATGQAADGSSGAISLPEGVAIHLPGNTILLTVVHLLNTQEVAVQAEARLNLWTMPAESVKAEAAIYQFYNPFIRVPARGASRSRMSCPVPSDVTIVSVQSHMHERGVSATASLVHTDGTQEVFYEGGYWDDVVVKTFDGGLKLKAGMAIDYECEYENTEDRTVLQGPYADDEMCVITGFYYPVDTAFANCATDDQAQNFSNAATYIGTGTASCAESLACVTGAAPLPEDKGEQLFGCMINSCPAVAEPLTAAFGCLFSQGAGMCQAECSGGGGPECSGCVQTACSAQIDACAAAACE